MGSLSLLQGIFPTQGLNPGLLHCRQILYQVSCKGSPRILEWIAYPFSSADPGIKPGSPALQADSLPTELSFMYLGSQVARVVKNVSANKGDIRHKGSNPGSGRSPGGGHGNPLQYSCLENPMDRGAWQATV